MLQTIPHDLHHTSSPTVWLLVQTNKVQHEADQRAIESEPHSYCGPFMASDFTHGSLQPYMNTQGWGLGLHCFLLCGGFIMSTIRSAVTKTYTQGPHETRSHTKQQGVVDMLSHTQRISMMPCSPGHLPTDLCYKLQQNHKHIPCHIRTTGPVKGSSFSML